MTRRGRSGGYSPASPGSPRRRNLEIPIARQDVAELTRHQPASRCPTRADARTHPSRACRRRQPSPDQCREQQRIERGDQRRRRDVGQEMLGEIDARQHDVDRDCDQDHAQPAYRAGRGQRQQQAEVERRVARRKRIAADDTRCATSRPSPARPAAAGVRNSPCRGSSSRSSRTARALPRRARAASAHHAGPPSRSGRRRARRIRCPRTTRKAEWPHRAQRGPSRRCAPARGRWRGPTRRSDDRAPAIRRARARAATAAVHDSRRRSMGPPRSSDTFNLPSRRRWLCGHPSCVAGDGAMAALWHHSAPHFPPWPPC